ncbi:MAG: ATP-binding protein [Gammaproteobacteria bacterium]|nr:ATP-binding protein [Gammaproteobacteria bacterium]MYC58674.1 ATP-binding protein [Gammaproteobacteria bacterium]MYH45066.1 ATP-binding protein [Gammaproteobacteria bacterium]MYL13934.1 ATP-binding protein [Gammaproteobacteria bacterium]
MTKFERAQKDILVSRLQEEPKRLIIVTGPRQAGKTTMVQQAMAEFRCRFVSADEPTRTFAELGALSIDDHTIGDAPSPGQSKDGRWLVQEWEIACKRLAESDSGYVLAIDEVQKIPNWSEIVKGLWDTDRLNNRPLHVILLGSAPLLMQSGMNESLAGRFEPIHLSHWSYPEMSALAAMDLRQYVYFGGYPGAASYTHEEGRWRNYILNSLIKPNIERDILAMERVDKPALLRTLFELSAQYSGQILSYTKLQGNLHDAGNTTTLARYLALLENAGLIAGLPKYTGSVLRRRSSSPKLIVLNTALMSALSDYSFSEAYADRTFWGRIVESSVGAHLFNTRGPGVKLFYWREQNDEVDFVLQRGRRLLAVEVRSGSKPIGRRGFDAFRKRFNTEIETLTVITEQGALTEDNVPLAEFLSVPADDWFKKS